MDTEPKEETKDKNNYPNSIKRSVNGKEYNIHMPSDPAEDNLCDGCQ